MKKIILWIAGVLLLIIIGVIGLLVVIGNYLPSDEGGSIASSVGNQMAPLLRKEMGTSEQATAPSMSDSDLGRSRVIIRAARIAIVSLDVKKAVESLKQYAEKNDGFIVDVQMQTEAGSPPSAEVSFRIPANKLDATVAFVRQQAATVESEMISGEDVTEEFVDVNAKLKNLQASVEQLYLVMKDAHKVEDILAVRRELERVRGEIDQLAGRKQYLEQSSKMSFVTVSIATDAASLPVVEPAQQWRPLIVAKDALGTLMEVLKFLVNVVIWFIVFVPVWGTYLLIKLAIKRRHAAAGKKK